MLYRGYGIHSLKDKEEGKNSMCDIMEKLMEKRSLNDRIECAKDAIVEGDLSIEKIAKLLNLPLTTVLELISSESESKAE